MTATMIGMLIDKGKLTWGSTIGDIFTDVAPAASWGFPESDPPGAPDPPGGTARQWPLVEARRTDHDRETAFSPTLIMKNAPQNRPGSTYAYSNVGYAIAGLMAEQVSGDSWEDLDAAPAFRAAGDDVPRVSVRRAGRGPSISRGVIMRRAARAGPT